MSTIYTLNGKVLTNATNNKWLTKKYVDPYNPLGLPPNTLRVRTSDGQPPRKISGWYSTSYETATLVEGTNDVYDVYKSGNSFAYLLYGFDFQTSTMSNVIEILGANTTGITNMQNMFDGCNISTAPLFDTSAVTNMASMFCNCMNLESVPLYDTANVSNFRAMLAGSTSGVVDSSKVNKIRTIPNFNLSSATDISYLACRTLIESFPMFNTSNISGFDSLCRDCLNLKAVPLLNTSSANNVTQMFYNCPNVESGALALYQQMSTQTTPPGTHTNTFTDCGSNTVTGAAELAQIPSSWGGTGA